MSTSAPKRKKPRSNDWRAFEEQVTTLFRSAGYFVTPNIEQGGFEFDLLAESPGPFGFTTRIAVECKYRTKAKVSNADIHTFLGAFDALRDKLTLSLGLVVTNSGFSRQAHEAAATDQNIKLLRFHDLEDYLLGLHSYFESVGTGYASLPVSSNFLTLAANQIDVSTKSSTKIPNVSEYVIAKLMQEDEFFGFLLGDFGSGKTTLAEHIHKRITESYLKNETDRVPFLFYLKTLPQFETEETFISSQFRQHSRELNYRNFLKLCQQRRVVFILDGFDEISTHATETERLGHFSRVMALAQNCHHFVLTSRPSYFGTMREINQLIETLIERDQSLTYRIPRHPRRNERVSSKEFSEALRAIRSKYIGPDYRLFSADSTELYFIRPLSKEQVLEYFSRFKKQLQDIQKASPKQIYEILTSIYDLSDLMTRPLLLTMFVEVLLEGSFRIDERDTFIGASEIYTTYINIHLDRDWKKGPQRQYLTRPERLEFARAAALTMFRSGGTLEAGYEGILKVIEDASSTEGKQYFGIDRSSFIQENMANVINDVRVCSFLSITSMDRIQFSHKSFMEFFVADIIASCLSRKSQIELLNQNLTWEILYFLGSFCLFRADYRVDLLYHLKNLAPRISEIYHRNSLVALLYSEQNSKEREFTKLEFDRLKIRKKQFSDCSFSQIVLDKAMLTAVDFLGCEFNRTLIAGEMRDLRLDDCHGALELEGAMTRITVSNILGYEESRLGAREALHIDLDGSIEDGKFEHATLSVGGDVVFKQCEINYCTVLLARSPSLRILNSIVSEVEFYHDSDGETLNIVPPVRESFIVHETQFRTCKFGGILLAGTNIDELNANGSLESSTGMLFVDQTNKKFRKFLRKRGQGNVFVEHKWAVLGGCLVLDLLAATKIQKELIELYQLTTKDFSVTDIEVACRKIFK